MACGVLSLVVALAIFRRAISIAEIARLGCLREKLVCTMASLEEPGNGNIRYYEVAISAKSVN